jgi:ubiquitin carboxyl-terminal hydrolase 8
LIDGLHEETNLRKFKPYIENPESENRDLIELGLESWSNNLQRDWSFIFFMFYGQMKSTLQCLTCKKESTTFDVFTNIPVSLPESMQLHLYVIIYRLPRKIKQFLEDSRF